MSINEFFVRKYYGTEVPATVEVGQTGKRCNNRFRYNTTLLTLNIISGWLAGWLAMLNAKLKYKVSGEVRARPGRL